MVVWSKCIYGRTKLCIYTTIVESIAAYGAELCITNNNKIDPFRTQAMETNNTSGRMEWQWIGHIENNAMGKPV